MTKLTKIQKKYEERLKRKRSNDKNWTASVGCYEWRIPPQKSQDIKDFNAYTAERTTKRSKCLAKSRPLGSGKKRHLNHA